MPLKSKTRFIFIKLEWMLVSLTQIGTGDVRGEGEARGYNLLIKSIGNPPVEILVGSIT